MSLDGCIAGAKGEVDWITSDLEIDFAAIFSQFDTLLIGRKTFEQMVRRGRAGSPGMRLLVFSSALQPSDFRAVTIGNANQAEAVPSIKQTATKDIWLFAGGARFQRHHSKVCWS
jgi:dihydrofolate reductase